MLLAPTLKNHFSTIIRERGYQYFRQQRVRIRYGSSSEFGAEVRGSEPYQVMLQWTGSQLAVLCECLYFVDQAKPCKHLWAAVLAADEAKHLSDAASSTGLTLDLDTLLDQFAEVGRRRCREAGPHPPSVASGIQTTAPTCCLEEADEQHLPSSRITKNLARGLARRRGDSLHRGYCQ